MSRTIGIISIWLNEARLAPFFLGHYSWADVIHIIIDNDTTDHSQEIVGQYSNTAHHRLHLPDGCDAGLIIDEVNRTAARLGTDWVIYADSDEFIGSGDLHQRLDAEPCGVVEVLLNSVYRHESESDLDESKPAWTQRRHGVPPTSLFIKPTVARSAIRPQWAEGGHSLKSPKNFTLSPDRIVGAHWNMADAEIAVQRRIHNQKNRMSARNIASGWCSHNFHITEGEIRAECERMKRCEVVL
jgi:hypothetical protein